MTAQIMHNLTQKLPLAILTIVVFMPMVGSCFARQGHLDKIFGDKPPKKAAAKDKEIDPENNQPKSKKETEVAPEKRELTIDEEIDQMQKVIANKKEAVRNNSVRPIKNWNEILLVANAYSKQVEEIRAIFPKGPPIDLVQQGLKKRFQHLDKTLSAAKKRLKEIETLSVGTNRKPGPEAIRQMSHQLFDVRLAENELMLEQLRWVREVNLPNLKIEIVNSKASIDLYYQERAPQKPKQRSGGDGMIGRLQQRVVDPIANSNRGGGILNATFHVDIEPKYDGVMGITFSVKSDVIAKMDKQIDIEKRVKLRAAADSFARRAQMFNGSLNIDRIEKLRRQGEIDLDASKYVFKELGLWKIKGKPSVKIRLVAEEIKTKKTDPESENPNQNN